MYSIAPSFNEAAFLNINCLILVENLARNVNLQRCKLKDHGFYLQHLSKDLNRATVLCP